MAEDYFKELKEAPYPLYEAPRPFSFDLNEDMIGLIRQEFSADIIASRFAEATNGKATDEVARIGRELFEEYGESWMKKTMQLGEQYPDRTIEVVMETVDSKGNQFLFFPHVPQRLVEIAYLSTQQFLTLPIVLSNRNEFVYRVPQCLLFEQIKEKCGAETANLMTCKNACLKALETLRQDLNLSVAIDMAASTAKDGHCQFSMKKR